MQYPQWLTQILEMKTKPEDDDATEQPDQKANEDDNTPITVLEN